MKSLRFSPSSLALAYIALSVLALALFAVPLWHAWRTNLSTLKAYVQGEELQGLVEVFDREGANGLTAAMASRAASLPGDQVMILADPSKRRLAGNLPAWPAQVPDAPGTYGLVIDIGGGATMRVVGSHVVLPDGYHLLLARESVLFHAFIERFWFGIAGAIAIVLVLSAGVGWLIRRRLLSAVQEISRTASAIVEGDLSRRLATRGGSPELDVLARTVNGMLAELASQNGRLENEIAVRRQAEQALHTAQEQLESVVEQRTAQLARANESLQRSEERYARAMEASDDGLWEWNPPDDQMFMSERARQLWGLPEGVHVKTRAELTARGGFLPDDVPRIEAAIQGSRAQAEGFDIEYRIINPAGETRWVRSRGKAFRHRSQVTGSLTDITERKLAAEALRENEARFRSLTELSSDWYWEQDENLRFTYLSNRTLDLTGYSGQSSIGKTRWELDGMTPLSSPWPEHQAVLAARQPFRDFEMCRFGPDGTARYLSISGAPIFDEQGRFRGYQGVGRNITERKRAEAELRSRQEMLDLAQKAARAVAFEWHIGAGEGQNRWSPDLEAMYGLAPGAYDGTFESWKKLVLPEDWPAVKAAIKRANESGDVAAEYRALQPDGTVRWLQAKGRMFFDAERKPTRMVGFMLDVTERHQAEDELLRLERQLRQAQRLEAMGTLAGGIAHDFNNILGAILGYGEMALRDAAKGGRLRRDLDSIMTAGERGRALVERILAFSRSSMDERVAVHVEWVAREALDQLAAKLPANVTIAPRLRAGRAAVLGDPTQVHQVLMNLATNAVQAMASGGTLSVSLEAVRCEAARPATIGNVAVGEYVVLTVADTGTGIAREIIDRIFDPFFTTKEVGTGTGLGLSLVHGIVTELRGAIDVTSMPGAGSEFTVYLPRSGDAPESHDDEALAMPRGDGQRVLIVDDEEPLVRLATETLADLGYAPVGFTSSRAALDAFRAAPERFDAVITDERMPGMTGSALIRELRGIRREIPILLMSGYIGGAVASRARDAGANEVLKKPVPALGLATSLARVLRQ